MKDWKLKDIDIWQEIDPLPVVQADHPSTDDEMLPVYRAIANAAVKKLVEWLDKNCSVVDNFVLRSCEDPIFDEGDVYFTKDEWRKLRQEVEL